MIILDSLLSKSRYDESSFITSYDDDAWYKYASQITQLICVMRIIQREKSVMTATSCSGSSTWWLKMKGEDKVKSLKQKQLIQPQLIKIVSYQSVSVFYVFFPQTEKNWIHVYQSSQQKEERK